jgi:hypothetical protein
MPDQFNRGKWAICAAFLILAAVSGCYTTSHAGAGAIAGAGLGGTMGAILGSDSGHAGGGALLGAVTGAMVGSLAGEAEDARDERDMAIAQARYERDQAARQSVTNADLINMAQAGLSDQVIINSVQTRGGQFDLSPSAIIELKSRGVNDNVILSIQRSAGNRSSGSVAAVYTRPTTTIVSSPPALYVVRPAPTFGVFVGSRPYGYRHRPHNWHHSHHW